jgi:rhodanese-related sulfurtransferase
MSPRPVRRLALIALAAVAATFAACSPAAAPAAPTTVPAAASSTAAGAPAALPLEVDVAGAVALQKAGAFVVDVREPSEWAAGHIAGATLVPLGSLATSLAKVPRDRQVVVVCRSGNRSAQGRDILLGAGYQSVTSMAGGMNAWSSAGNPVTTGA